MTSRSLARSAALGAVILGVVWVVAVSITGGFALPIGGRTFSSREPMRPLYWTTVPLLLFVLANGVEKTARTWASCIARIDHRIAAAGLTLATLTLGASYATTAAIGSDAYGYVSEADLWLKGNLHIPQPWVSSAPWPDAERTFSPLAYRPAGTGDPTDLVPVYSPGLPLLMAAAKGVAGHGAAFLIVPIAGAMLVLTTWGIGRRWGSSAAGLIGALLVASSPAFLFMDVTPMSDVPAAAFWALCFYLLLGSRMSSGLGAGVAAAIAILIRPNLVWLAVPPGIWLLWRTLKSNPETRGVSIGRLSGFSAGIILAALAVAFINARLYGSPLRSGYGELGPLFALSNVGLNLRIYLDWLIASQTPLILVGLAAVIWPARTLWPAMGDRTFFLMAGFFCVGLWVFYLFYIPFGEWWFLRFLLPSWPFIMLGLAAAIVAVARSSSAGFVVCVWLVVVLGFWEYNDCRARGTFELWSADRGFVAAALETRDATPASSVIISSVHTGSVRYYGGRMTLQYMWLDGAWLDRVVAWLDEHGASSYLLLRREEVEVFKTRFKGAAMLARLDGPPIFEFADKEHALYALSEPFTGQTKEVTYDPRQLRSQPPVASLPFALR